MARKTDTEEAGDKAADRPSARTRSVAAINLLRTRIAQVVLIVFTLCALLLAIGALLVALRHNINSGNALVKAIEHFDDVIDGPFSRNKGIFTFHGKNSVSKEALVNWGIAAIVYLLVGRILNRIIRP